MFSELTAKHLGTGSVVRGMIHLHDLIDKGL
jgi:hypothetical protein